MILEATGWQLEPTPWTARAACVGSRPDLWFPQRGDSPAAARAICAACPVRRECADYAVRWDIQHGIWGGLSVRERRRLQPSGRPRRFPAAHGTTTRYARGCRCEGCGEAATLDKQLREERLLEQAFSGVGR